MMTSKLLILAIVYYAKNLTICLTVRVTNPPAQTRDRLFAKIKIYVSNVWVWITEPRPAPLESVVFLAGEPTILRYTGPPP